jgi:hypothetical protein
MLFICNSEERFYNDNHKEKKVFNCNWKDLLQRFSIHVEPVIKKI